MEREGSEKFPSPDIALAALNDATNAATSKPPAKKFKKATNGPAAIPYPELFEYNEADYEPGTGLFPPGSEDGFDPNIILDESVPGKIRYKTQEERQATKPQVASEAETGTLRIHTDGSSLGNGKAGAFAGVGVYFGPSDKR